MANYTEGLVAISDNSVVVQGIGTRWSRVAGVKGRAIVFAGLNAAYQIAAVVSDTGLMLTRPVHITGLPDSSFGLTNLEYCIVDSFTPNISIPIVRKDDVDKQPRLVRGFTAIDQNKSLIVGWQIENNVSINGVPGRAGLLQLGDFLATCIF